MNETVSVSEVSAGMFLKCAFTNSEEETFKEVDKKTKLKGRVRISFVGFGDTLSYGHQDMVEISRRKRVARFAIF